MAYWIKRIILKSGEIVTERELRPDENRSDDAPPVVGDEITVTCRGRSFRAKVIWGNWEKNTDKLDPRTVVPLRVEEI
jgi:hypothetical protein